jgi:hypothetical protein
LPATGWQPYASNHMKIAIEIADTLLEDAEQIATRDGVTLRTLVESGLRHELAERHQPTAFRLRRASFKGKGLQPAARSLTSDQQLDLPYAGRGS